MIFIVILFRAVMRCYELTLDVVYSHNPAGIVDEVLSQVEKWPEFARAAGGRQVRIVATGQNQRLELKN